MITHKTTYCLTSFYLLGITSYNKLKRCFYLLLIFPFFIVSVQANENEQIILSCKTLTANPKHPRALPCIYYIRGIFNGAMMFDHQKPDQSEDKDSKKLTWHERAYKIRVGDRCEEHITKNTSFLCMPPVEIEENIIKQLSENALDAVDNINDLNTQIFSAINKRCRSSQKVKTP